MKHVFLVANPVIGIVAYEYIARNNSLNQKNVEIIFVRGQRYSIFDGYKVKVIKRSLFNRASRRFKVFENYPQSVRRFIEASCDRFVLYASWLDQVASEVLESHKCLGHCYLEEGDQAYKNFPIFPASNLYLRPEKNESNKHEYNHYWREDAFFWVATHSSAFPSVPERSKVILKSFDKLKDVYIPVLKDGDTVLLMPTPGRLPKAAWLKALKTLSSHSEKQAYVKLHPGYSEIYGGVRKVHSLIKSGLAGDLVILPETTILEAEMLFSRLICIGDRSSVQRYAERFGSSFIQVPFLHGDYY